MDEGDLEPEEPAVRLLVGQLDSLVGEGFELTPQVSHLVGDVVDTRAAVGEELADVGLVTKRGEQLHAVLTNTEGRRVDALGFDGLAPLELGAEQAPVRLDGLVEILDRDPEMVNALRLHAKGS